MSADDRKHPGLVVLGAAGHGREMVELLLAASEARRSNVPLVGMLDDDAALHGTSVCGVRVLGGFELLEREMPFQTVLGVGYPEAKRRMVAKVAGRSAGWPAALHPAAVIGGAVEIGEGAQVQAGVVLTTAVRVGAFATLNIGSTVSHDCQIGAWATLCPGVHLGGAVTVGEGTFLGIGATVIQGVEIGSWSVVGAGAVVTDDVPENAVVVGSPARKIKDRAPGWQEGR